MTAGENVPQAPRRGVLGISPRKSPRGRSRDRAGHFHSMPYYLGIDGGATHTTAWLADEHGRLLARAEAGPSNPVKVGFEAAQREILRAAKPALAVAALRRKGTPGRAPAKFLDAVCAGMAGVDRPRIHRPLLAWMKRAIPARRHLLTVDFAITLRAALGMAPGIVVSSGTGSFAYGRASARPGARMVRVGGWGIPFDDRGSGYELGVKAVGAALQDFDGRGPHTALTRQICRAFGLRNIIQIVGKPLSQHEVAALSAIVAVAARHHDRVAQRLCREAGADLAALACAVIKRFGWQRRAFPVVCAGGVIKSSDLIRAALARHVREFAPRAQISLLKSEPVEGALDMARHLS